MQNASNACYLLLSKARAMGSNFRSLILMILCYGRFSLSSDVTVHGQILYSPVAAIRFRRKILFICCPVENILLIIIHRGAISISGTLSIRLRFSTHAAIFYVCEYGSRLDMHSPPTGTTDAPGHPPTPPLATHWPPAHAAMTL